MTIIVAICCSLSIALNIASVVYTRKRAAKFKREMAKKEQAALT